MIFINVIALMCYELFSFWKEKKMTKETVRMMCPHCGNVREIPVKYSKGKGIDGLKCSPCFKDRSIFVNLVLTQFEINKKIEKENLK